MKFLRFCLPQLAALLVGSGVSATPPVTTGLFLDLQGDNPANFAFSTGTSITSWLDQAAASGSQDYGQSTATKQPTMVSVAMPNGSLHNVVDFVRGTPTSNTRNSTATSQFLSNSGGSAYESAAGSSLFVVFKNRLTAQPTVSARQRAVIYQDRNSTQGDVMDLQTSETNLVGPDTLTPDLFVQLRDPTDNGMSNAETVGDIRTDVWYAVGTSWDYAAGIASTRYLYSDGTVFDASQTGTPWPTGLPSGRVDSSLIGALSSSSTGGVAWDGQIAEILRYDTPLSSSDFDTTMSYLKNKYFVATALTGDYNGDGKVDAADYVLWRKDPSSHGGDPIGYMSWRGNFGAGAGSGSKIGGGSVPEPTTFVLYAAAAAIGFLSTRRNRDC